MLLCVSTVLLLTMGGYQYNSKIALMDWTSDTGYLPGVFSFKILNNNTTPAWIEYISLIIETQIMATSPLNLNLIQSSMMNIHSLLGVKECNCGKPVYLCAPMAYFMINPKHLVTKLGQLQ